MSEFQRCVGINLTASKLQFVEIEKESDHLRVDNLGQTFISPPIIYDVQDETLIQQQLQAAFDELRIRNPISSNIASFTLPPELFITIQLPYEANLTHKEIREEFNWEISQLFPFISVEELAIKFYELDGSFLPGRNNALVVALNKNFLLLIKNFCLKNNLTPKLVDNASITANSFINSYLQNGKKSATINIFNSKNSITLFINISSKPAFVKVFQKQDDYINKLIGEISRDDFREVVNNSFKSAILSGEGLDGELLAEIGRGTELVFEKFNPFEVVKFKPELRKDEITSDQFSSFTSAIGIASRFN
jgi:Tfp pilus assembly PilM family ATPase